MLVSSLDGPETLHAITNLLVVDDRDHESTSDTRYVRRLIDAGILHDATSVVELGEDRLRNRPRPAGGERPGRLLPRRPRQG